MTAGATRRPARGSTGMQRILDNMNKNHERGEKRGVLSTGRAKQLDTEDADADAADDEETDE